MSGRVRARAVGKVHYVMDLFYPDSTARDGLRREVQRIDAPDDDAAIVKAKRMDRWRASSFFRVRAIRTSVRSGDLVVYDSQLAIASVDQGDSDIAIELSGPVEGFQGGGEIQSPAPEGNE